MLSEKAEKILERQTQMLIVGNFRGWECRLLLVSFYKEGIFSKVFSFPTLFSKIYVMNIVSLIVLSSPVT